MPNTFLTDERGDSRNGEIPHSEVSVSTGSTSIAAANQANNALYRGDLFGIVAAATENVLVSEA